MQLEPGPDRGRACLPLAVVPAERLLGVDSDFGAILYNCAGSDPAGIDHSLTVVGVADSLLANWSFYGRESEASVCRDLLQRKLPAPPFRIMGDVRLYVRLYEKPSPSFQVVTGPSLLVEESPK